MTPGSQAAREVRRCTPIAEALRNPKWDSPVSFGLPARHESTADSLSQTTAFRHR